MFIECTNCEFKYLVNSADLKPNGRMVECANCGYQWYQDLDDINTRSSIIAEKKENIENTETNYQKTHHKNQVVKNLPSTIVRNEKPSILNSIIVVALIIIIIFGFWIFRSIDINTFVLIDFYIKEFFFNLNLIISDLAKIFYDILN